MELPDRSAPALNPERQIPSYDTCPASERPSASITRSSISTGRSKGSSSESTHRGSHELKPRLSKDQQEALERHYQSETKPSTQTKKEFSQLLGVSSEKINVGVSQCKPIYGSPTDRDSHRTGSRTDEQRPSRTSKNNANTISVSSMSPVILLINTAILWQTTYI